MSHLKIWFQVLKLRVSVWGQKCDGESYITKNFIMCIRNRILLYTVEPGYNDVDLYDTSFIASDIVWYKSVPHIST